MWQERCKQHIDLHVDHLKVSEFIAVDKNEMWTGPLLGHFVTHVKDAQKSVFRAYKPHKGFLFLS